MVIPARADGVGHLLFVAAERGGAGLDGRAAAVRDVAAEPGDAGLWLVAAGRGGAGGFFGRGFFRGGFRRWCGLGGFEQGEFVGGPGGGLRLGGGLGGWRGGFDLFDGGSGRGGFSGGVLLVLKLDAGLFEAVQRGEGFGAGGGGFTGGEGVVVGFEGGVLGGLAFEIFPERSGEELWLGGRRGEGREDGEADGFLVRGCVRRRGVVDRAKQKPSGSEDEEQVEESRCDEGRQGFPALLRSVRGPRAHRGRGNFLRGVIRGSGRIPRCGRGRT